MTDAAVDGDDEIARCIIFPKAFQGAAHTDEVLFVFGQSGADGRSHESGVLCRLVGSDGGIHDVGCRIALIQNERAGTDPSSSKRRYYCGFRKAVAKDVAISSDKYRVTLTLDGEGGEAAHIDIAVWIGGESKNERSTIKVEVGLILAEAFGPVVSHICAGDVGDERHPLRSDPECLIRGIPRFSALQSSLPIAP
jgi:hypothetical protein